MRIVKYICRKCNYAEPLNRLDYIKEVLKELFCFTGVGFVIGLAVLAYLFSNPEVSSKLRGFDFGAMSMTFAAHQEDKELRMLALDLTKNCSRASVEKLERCSAQMIYIYVRNFDYRLGNYENRRVYSPEEIIEYGAADCKNQAYLYVSLVSQLGIDARVECRMNHCFPLIKFSDNDTFVADTTNDIYGYWEDWEDFYSGTI